MKKVARNVAGFCLVIIGCMMIFTPGPGLFTILSGLYLADFPGKPVFVKKLKNTKFYRRRLAGIELKIRSKFKRKNI